MGLLPSHQDDKADAVRAAVPAAKLTPKGVISVTGKPSFANLLTFQVGCRTKCVAVQCVTMLPGHSAFTPERHGRRLPHAGGGTRCHGLVSALEPPLGIAGPVQTASAVQREAIKGTTFKFTVADATIRNIKTARGYVVSGKRTDGASRLMPDSLTSVISEQPTPLDHTVSSTTGAPGHDLAICHARTPSLRSKLKRHA